MNILKLTNGHEEEIIDYKKYYHPITRIDDDFEKSGCVFWCRTHSGQYILDEIILRDKHNAKLPGETKTYSWKKFNGACEEYFATNDVIEAIIDTSDGRYSISLR